jgi:hypothetical protein
MLQLSGRSQTRPPLTVSQLRLHIRECPLGQGNSHDGHHVPQDRLRKAEASAVDFHCKIIALDEKGAVVRTAKIFISGSATVPATESVRDHPMEIEIAYAFLVGHPSASISLPLERVLVVSGDNEKGSQKSQWPREGCPWFR